MGMQAGKVAVITGGISGIGAAAARLFAAEGSTAEFARAEVSAEADARALIGHVVARFGRLDCLVNNAGVGGTPGGVASVDMDRFWHALAVNLGGVVLGMKYAAPVLARQGSGSIINVASIGGRFAGWSMLDYSAVQAAVIHLTRCTASQLGEHGVRVNSVSPGPVVTGLFGKGAGVDPAEADRTAAQRRS
jgi:NAD(P)-dependent dehydrogenase (short-subunit alcohol dehydrogenase family)